MTSVYSPGDDEHLPLSQRKRPRLGKDGLGKGEYAVERIVDVDRADPSDIKYLIKWKGWPAKYNTWEPMAHLKSLKDEIEAFEASR